MRITIVSGARPNFMKIAPICRAIDAAREAGKNISYRIVYTGPQDDTSLDASLFSDLSMRKPDAYLGVTGHNHSQVAASIMLAFERELDGHPAQVVLVVDDMTATMSCSIVAKKRGLKVAHVIAGTRSFDMNMPREVNRTIVDAISDYLFTAGMVANRNLNQEGMIPEYIHYVGNILIDTIRFNRHRLVQPMWFSSLGLRKGNYLLLTLNRRDLLEKKAVLHSLLQTVIEKAGGMPIVAPLHPYVQKAVKSLEVNATQPAHPASAELPALRIPHQPGTGHRHRLGKHRRRSYLPRRPLHHPQYLCRASRNLAHRYQRAGRRKFLRSLRLARQAAARRMEAHHPARPLGRTNGGTHRTDTTERQQFIILHKLYPKLANVYPKPTDAYPKLGSFYPKAWDRTFSIRCATLSFISGNFSIRILYVFYLYPANKTYDFHVHLTISPVSLVYICFLINLNLLTLRPNYL